MLGLAGWYQLIIWGNATAKLLDDQLVQTQEE